MTANGPTRPDSHGVLAALARRVAPGAVLAGCVIERELGRGAMGAVFLARDGAGRAVAVKVLLAGLGSPERLTRLRREAEVLAALDHPGIVRVLGHDLEHDPPCLVLEFVDGRDLARVVADDHPTLARRLELLEEVARAVAHAHERRVIHRDLKPANVLVGRDGRAKVADFGLARELDQRERLTRTGSELGTPAYMAPEQVRADKAVGPAADVHAIGVMLYELTTGRLPWSAETPMALYDQVLRAIPTRPSRVARRLSPDVDAVVARALAKDPARRYSARALADDLGRLRRGQRVAARPRGARALQGLGVTAAVILLGAALVAITRPSVVPPPATPSIPVATPPTPPTTDAPIVATPTPATAEDLARVERYRAAQARAAEALAIIDAFAPGGEQAAADAVEALRAAATDALAEVPDAPEALLLRARAHDLALEFEDAAATLDALLDQGDLEPALARDALLLRAYVGCGVGGTQEEGDKPQRAWDDAVRRAPEDAALRAGRGLWRLFQRAQRDVALLDDLRRGRAAGGVEGPLCAAALALLDLEASPTDAGARAALTRALGQALPAAGADDGRPFDVRARARRLLGETAEADADARAGLERHARRAGPLGRLLRLAWADRRAVENEGLTERGRPARRALRRFCAERPGHPVALAELAIVPLVLSWRRGPAGDSELRWIQTQFTRAIAPGGTWWEAHFYYGHLLRTPGWPRRDLPGAVGAFTRAVELKPDHAWSLTGRARCHLELGRADLAEQDARRATELVPALEDGWALLAAALRAQGREAEAAALRPGR